MFLGAILDTSPCLGQACVVPGLKLDATTQTAGAVVMIIIVLALAWYGNRKWRSPSQEMIGAAPA